MSDEDYKAEFYTLLLGSVQKNIDSWRGYLDREAIEELLRRSSQLCEHSPLSPFYKDQLSDVLNRVEARLYRASRWGRFWNRLKGFDL